MLHVVPVEGDAEVIRKTGLYYRVSEGAEFGRGGDLLVMVHGRAGNAKVMWPFARVARGLNAVIVTPQAPEADPLGGWSWWPGASSDPKDPTRTKATLDEVLAGAKKLQCFVEHLRDIYSSERVLAVGFSQGGAALSTVALTSPSLIARVGMLASFVPQLVLERFTERTTLPPFFFGHGTRDEIVTEDRARRSAHELEQRGASTVFFTDDVGHKVGSNSLRELESWIAASA